MSQCNRLEKFLEKGHFGESLSDIPDKLRNHLNQCEECREYYELLVETEREMVLLEPELPDVHARARIRTGVDRKLAGEAGPRPWFGWLKPGWNLAVAAALLLIVLTVPNLPERSFDTMSQQVTQELPAELTASLNESLADDLIKYTEPDIYEMETIASIQNETTVLFEEFIDDESIDSIDVNSQSIITSESGELYDSFMLTQLSELDDDDWNELRRFLS